MAGAVGLLVAVPQLYHRMDEEVRRRIELRLVERYPDLKPVVRYAALVKGRGIEIRGLSIFDPAAEGPGAELIHVEEMFLACSTELEDLLTGEPEVTQIFLRRPTLRITRRPGENWNVTRLFSQGTIRHKEAELRVEGGTIEVCDQSKAPAGRFSLREVNFTLFAPDFQTPAGDNPALRRFEASAAGSLMRRLEISGRIDPERPEWTVSGTIDGVEISPELRDALPAELATRLASLDTLRGQAAVGMRAGYDPAATPPYTFEISAQLTRGRFDDSRLPYPLSDIRAACAFDNEGIRIGPISAHCGQSTIRASYHRRGYAADSPCAIEVKVPELELNRQLEDVLPEALRPDWRKYLPAGRVGLEAKFSFDGKTWRPQIAVECLNVSYSYYKFPYRLERSTGQIELKNDVVTARLTGYAGNQPIRISAEVAHPFQESEHFGWLEAKGDNLPLDEKLLAALPAPTQATIRALQPRGTINGWFRIWRDRPGEPIQRRLKLWLNQCGICYAKFPYPIGNIGGLLEMRGDHWDFRDLEGNKDTGHITCSGYLTPTPRGHELCLSFTGTSIPLDGDLRLALKPDMQQVWDDLKPQGTADILDAEVVYASDRDHLEVSFRARPRSESAAIEPVYFPYRLEKLHGVVAYRDGLVTLEQFKGDHGNVRFAADGTCKFAPEGGWRFDLKNLAVDRLRLDRELMQALPLRLKKAFVELNPRGAMDLQGAVSFAREAGFRAPVTSAWDLGIVFQQAAFDCGVAVENVSGGLRLTGQFNGQRFGTRAELDIDSANYKDFQFTQVKGPVWLDDDRLLLGTLVDRPFPGPHAAQPAVPERQPRAITAELFGGRVQAGGWVTLALPEFDVGGTFANVDLSRLAQEAAPGRRNLRGKIAASISLHGTGRSANGLGGRGRVHLSEADIYELPVMISMLKLLNLREPNTKAFSASDVAFRLEGKNIYFDSLTFNGDAISLEGTGEMSLADEKINLTLHAPVVGRGGLNLPFVRQVIGGASQQIMQIHVGGTIQNPESTPEAFPGVNQVLQQFQSGLSPDPVRK
ncbi:MAG: AsmA-like C-terminal region-containing protein [Thermoguttaceae bacterium]